MIVRWLARSRASRSISPHGWQGILASIVLSPSSTASSNSVKTMVSQSLVTDAGRRRVTPALDAGGGDAGSLERTPPPPLAPPPPLPSDTNPSATSPHPPPPRPPPPPPTP